MYRTPAVNRPLLVVAVGVALLLFFSGCAKTVKTSGQSSGKGGSGLVRVHYVSTGLGEGGTTEIDVIADGDRRTRWTVVASEDHSVVGTWIVWDGTAVLRYETSSEQPYTLIKNASLEPGSVPVFVYPPGSKYFAIACPQAHRLGTQKVIGHDAVRYACAKSGSGPGQTPAHELSLDQKTGLMLKIGAGGFSTIATKITANPPVKADTFSTTPPKGAKVKVPPSKTPATGRAVPAFSLELLSGGTVSSKDLAGKPYVLAFFASDLTFDPSGDACAGCVQSLINLQSLTHNGKTPSVLAVQVGSKGKPGYPLVPKGVTLRTVNDPTRDLQETLGLTKLAGFVFIGSDGKVTATFDGAATQQQLGKALAALK